MRILKRGYSILSTQFGLNPVLAWRGIINLPRYLSDLLRFRSEFDGRIDLVPCLHDRGEEGGSTTGEYFWQDLLVAQMIAASRPERHVDVGSRVDGFVAHVASFREIEVFDIRPVTSVVPGVKFLQADLMRSVEGKTNYCDSLSCLHALEHFGLGRYGDPIDPGGFCRGLENMTSILKPGGTFYLSVPIGISRVEFNANRVFDPRTIIALGADSGLDLARLIVFQGGEISTIEPNEAELRRLADLAYALGIFVFRKHVAPKNDAPKK